MLYRVIELGRSPPAAALYVLYPGLYLLGAALYFVTLIVLQWTLSRERRTGYTPINGSTSNT